jgi:hypothetical protein
VAPALQRLVWTYLKRAASPVALTRKPQIRPSKKPPIFHISTAMSILLKSSIPPCCGYDSSAWAEVDRLRSRKHLLTIRPAFRPVSGDKEREQRRKKRQWQHWQNAMDAAIVEAFREEAILKEKELKAAATALVEAVSKQPPVFSSRSPTLLGEPLDLPKTFPLGKADLGYQFTFTCPAAPSWIPRTTDACTGDKQRIRHTPSYKRKCIGVPSTSGCESDIACGRRLLSRWTPAERAALRRWIHWRSKSA